MPGRGVLISESSSSDTPTGLSWLSASGLCHVILHQSLCIASCVWWCYFVLPTPPPSNNDTTRARTDGDWVKEPLLRVSANVPDKPRDRIVASQAAVPQPKRSSPQSIDSGAVLRSGHAEGGAAGGGAEALAAATEMVAKLEAEISQLMKRALDAEAKLEVRNNGS